MKEEIKKLHTHSIELSLAVNDCYDLCRTICDSIDFHANSDENFEHISSVINILKEKICKLKKSSNEIELELFKTVM
ncbi:hypothetical protein IJ541_02830 [bacterium]|nr:hypothetical protein [bacterium]